MKLKLTVDGKLYEVDVEVAEPEPPRPGYVPPAGKLRHETTPGAAPPARSGGEKVADESKVCRSPIAGVVVKVSAQVGQEIHVDDVLLVLEAMKMETMISAPIAGKIAKVNAQVGDSVQVKQVLIEFE
ncbi:MAG: biotin/lipoyl-containing protein [Pirellulales bacterium]